MIFKLIRILAWYTIIAVSISILARFYLIGKVVTWSIETAIVAILLSIPVLACGILVLRLLK